MEPGRCGLQGFGDIGERSGPEGDVPALYSVGAPGVQTPGETLMPSPLMHRR